MTVWTDNVAGRIKPTARPNAARVSLVGHPCYRISLSDISTKGTSSDVSLPRAVPNINQLSVSPAKQKHTLMHAKFSEYIERK
jgi:hypothetical protein